MIECVSCAGMIYRLNGCPWVRVFFSALMKAHARSSCTECKGGPLS